MKSEQYKRHIYDLELKTLFEQYKKGISNVQLNTTDKTQEYFVNLVQTNLENYCRLVHIDFKDEFQIIITPVEDGAYKMCLNLSLIFYEKHKIKQYLNYHEQLFKSLTKTKDQFVGVIEFQIVDAIKASSPFDNSERLSEIMDWVESKNLEYQSIDPNHINSKKRENSRTNLSANDKLLWKLSPDSLKDLSEILFEKKYTKRKLDFRDVFTFHKIIDWKGDYETWVYLIYKLAKSPKPCIITSENARNYWKTANKFFNFYNNEKEILKNSNPSSTLHNILKRSKNKYSQRTATIDSWVDTVLK
jgi:hypothetical protein